MQQRIVNSGVGAGKGRRLGLGTIGKLKTNSLSTLTLTGDSLVGRQGLIAIAQTGVLRKRSGSLWDSESSSECDALGDTQPLPEIGARVQFIYCSAS